RSHWRQALVWMVVPLCLVAVPWMCRNGALTGNPVFGRRGMELWMYTPALPGFSAYRMLPGDVATHGHGVFGVVTKMASQWSQILETFPRLTGIFLLALFI